MASVEEIRKIRLARLAALRKQGIDPYPARVRKTHTQAEVQQFFDRLVDAAEPIFLTGRIRAIRSHGGSAFVDVEDSTGQVQVFLQQEKLSRDYKVFQDYTDLGDFVEVSGHLFKTKQAEKTLAAATFKIIVKALRPIPEEWYGLKNIEERLRQRYLDLILNKPVKETFIARSKIFAALRAFLAEQGFMELDTPVLQSLAGGAAARPFKTHLNALDVDLYLRIAPELYLKRLLVGGFEKIYELARCFRNEGLDYAHNPEFTMLELYAVWHDYEWLMGFSEEMFRYLATELYNKPQFVYQGNVINLEPKFRRLTFVDMLKEYAGVDWLKTDRDGFAKVAQEHGIAVEPGLSKGNIADEIYKKICRPKIIQPTYIIIEPVEISPFAKQGDAPEGFCERFHLVVGGLELVNGFSELNDPVDQRSRFLEQEKLRAEGSQEAQPLDQDFLRALEYGMPPTAGLGMGLDRLVALLTNQYSIRDTILFPFLRPK